MKENSRLAGHGAALFTVTVWGTTFVSTKVLLNSFSPIEILLIRFVLGLAVLSILSPRWLKLENWKQELTFAGAGLTGVCLYFLMENMALVYGSASTVGVIVSSAPLFTAIFTSLFYREERLSLHFLAGFVSAMLGIFLISFTGSQVELNLKGDLMALVSAMSWGIYSVLTKRISTYGHPTIAVTRRIFCWGVLFMLPGAVLLGFQPQIDLLLRPVNFLNLLYLGFLASAGCFVLWNFALRRLGALKTSAYIYATPAITVVTAGLLLHEQVTVASLAGTAMVVAGLLLSEMKTGKDRSNGRIVEKKHKT